jgi:phosphoenolpyruvate carboxykinase (ATP)
MRHAIDRLNTYLAPFLVARYPGKVHFAQYNTGGMGEIIDVDKASAKKTLVRKVSRVPIDLMAALQRGDLRGTNEYAKGRLGTEYVVRCEGGDLAAYDARNFYSDEQIEAYVADIVDGRRKFTEQIAAQGLRKDIREIAHRELDAIDTKSRKKAEPWAPPEEAAASQAAEDRDPRSRWISPWEPRRPGAGMFSATGGKRR